MTKKIKDLLWYSLKFEKVTSSKTGEFCYLNIEDFDKVVVTVFWQNRGDFS